jgi:RNA exonuclease 1
MSPNEESPQDSKRNNKRKHESELFSVASSIPLPKQELPAFNLISRPASRDEESPTTNGNGDEKSSQEWQTVGENGRPKKKAKKLPKKESSNYPQISFSSKDSRLQSQIKISDLQNLVLYILADGISPQFVSVRHRSEIRKVVVLMVPGLEREMFHDLGSPSKEKKAQSGHPDAYYPEKLIPDKLPLSLRLFSDMFEHLWPVKTPGDDRYAKMHSPLQAMLTAPIPKNKEEKNREKNRSKGASLAKEPAGWQNKRTPITHFIQTPEELLENDYVVHPAAYDNENDKVALQEHRRSTGVSKDHGWVDTMVKSYDEGDVPENEIESGSLTAGREILAMDCEMCKTGESEFSLTRISIIGWDGTTILDELVKPDKPITDYLTM